MLLIVGALIVLGSVAGGYMMHCSAPFGSSTSSSSSAAPPSAP